MYLISRKYICKVCKRNHRATPTYVLLPPVNLKIAPADWSFIWNCTYLAISSCIALVELWAPRKLILTFLIWVIQFSNSDPVTTLVWTRDYALNDFFCSSSRYLRSSILHTSLHGENPVTNFNCLMVQVLEGGGVSVMSGFTTNMCQLNIKGLCFRGFPHWKCMAIFGFIIQVSPIWMKHFNQSRSTTYGRWFLLHMPWFAGISPSCSHYSCKWQAIENWK